MLHFPQVSRAAARAATIALVVLVATVGVPAAAFAGILCGESDTHCPKQTAHEHRCSENAVVMSCTCHGAEQPANSSSSRATDLVSAGSTQALQSYVPHADPGAGCSRPDYLLARGRHSVPLPILHASLLI